jgi:hypothetical protein
VAQAEVRAAINPVVSPDVDRDWQFPAAGNLLLTQCRPNRARQNAEDCRLGFAGGMNVTEVVSSLVADHSPGAGMDRLASLAGRLIGLGLIGGAHLAWRVGAAGLGLAGAGALVSTLPQLLGERDFSMSPVQAATTPPSRIQTASAFNVQWQTVSRPIAVFGLESPELDRLALVYEARRALSGPERDDTLRFGRFGDGAAHLHVSARRSGDEPGLSSRFFNDLARESSRHDLSLERTAVPVGMPTKFGLVETADAAFSGAKGQRACIAFRHLSTLQPLQLTGWWCGTSERPADRAQLACLIDRFDLLSAGEDRPLRQLFAQAELNRNTGCSVSRLALSGRKANWLDSDGKVPPFKKGAAR